MDVLCLTRRLIFQAVLVIEVYLEMYGFDTAELIAVCVCAVNFFLFKSYFYKRRKNLGAFFQYF